MSSPKARRSIAASSYSDAGPARPGAAALAASLALHALLLAGLLVRFAVVDAPPPARAVEVEYVEQLPAKQGAAAPARPAPAPAAPATLPPGGDVPVSTPTPPAPTRPANPAVNLGDADADRDPLLVTGDVVKPAAPDARFHNLPPRYPAEAVRARAEGTVSLLARIAPSGVPQSVLVTGSSGNASLDDEARRAVLLWRFRPAVKDGERVPYDYPLSIHFKLDERP